MEHKPYGPYEKFFKRPLDILLSLCALLLLSPVMIIIAVLVRIKLGSPVLFTQERPGKYGRIFKIYKFRTMTNDKYENGELLSDDLRLTKFGKILRSTSLDELPELFNIIRGDMSIVGPRPLLVCYLPRYNERQQHRHDVRPGLTGLAQIHGRNEISWNKKLELDLKYVDRITFWNDFMIIMRTVFVVLKHKGILINCPEFTGSEADE